MLALAKSAAILRLALIFLALTACQSQSESDGWLHDLTADSTLTGPTGLAVLSNGHVWVADPGAGIVHRWTSDGQRLDPLSRIANTPLVEPIFLSELSDGSVTIWDRGQGQFFSLAGIDYGAVRSFSVTPGAIDDAIVRDVGLIENELHLLLETFPEMGESGDGKILGETSLRLVRLLDTGETEAVGESQPGARILYIDSLGERRGIYLSWSRRSHVMMMRDEVLLLDGITGEVVDFASRDPWHSSLRRLRTAPNEPSDAAYEKVGATLSMLGADSSILDAISHIRREISSGNIGHVSVNSSANVIMAVVSAENIDGERTLQSYNTVTGRYSVAQMPSHGRLRAFSGNSAAVAVLEEGTNGGYVLQYRFLRD